MKIMRDTLFILKSLIPLAIIIYMIVWAILANRLGYVYGFAAMVLFLTGVFLWVEIDIKIKRCKGIFPKKGQTTLEDVKRLAISGRKSLAIRAYMDLKADVMSKRAEREVDKIIAESKVQDK